MKRFMLVMVLFIALGIFAKPAKIFIVNLYEEPVDIWLGEAKKPVVYKYNLDPYTPTRMIYTTNYGDHILYFKLSGNEKWYKMKETNGKIFYCSIEPDKNYCILVLKNGFVDFFILKEDNKPDPKICFINGSDKKVKRMELSNEWKGSVSLYCEDYEPNAISNFGTIPQGNYSMFWQFPFQVYEEDYYYYPNKDRTGKEIFKFVDGEYSLFLIYTKNNEEYGIIYNITPKD